MLHKQQGNIQSGPGAFEQSLPKMRYAGVSPDALYINIYTKIPLNMTNSNDSSLRIILAEFLKLLYYLFDDLSR